MPVRKRLPSRTWPVFLIGIGSLLALLFLPGIVALRKTASVYRDIRRIQDAHQQTQQLLTDIERRVYLISITVREALLDPSPTTTTRYSSSFQQRRLEIEQQIAALKQQPLSESRVSIPKLEEELEGYFDAIGPVFDWPPARRSARAIYFLREQQRPRRESILKIAEEISRLTEASYSKQLDQVNQSQIKFGDDIQRVIAVAFLIGIIIASFTVARITTLEDRSEKHRIKTETAEEELRSLSAKLMQTQEEERKTISRELHDEVGQTLTGLRMGLGGLERLTHDKEAFREQITELKSLAEQSLRTVRDIAVGLRPSVLDLGLVPAVQWQLRRFSKYSGVPASVHQEGDLEDVPEEYRTCVYRVVQECLTNAVRHSGAKTVRVELRKAGSVLEVAVRDDGSGFRSPQARDGLGLLGMEERVRELGGVLTVESAVAAGTSVRARLPIPGKNGGNA